MSSSDSSSSRTILGIVDDHPALRRAVREAVEEQMGMEVVAEAGSVEEGFRKIEEMAPDVAIVDLAFGEGHGFQLLENVRAQCSDTALVVFSTYDEETYAQRALQIGAMGYVMKTDPLDELVNAIRRVASGGIYLSPKLTSQVLRGMVEGDADAARFPIDDLTDRELQVFQMLGQGMTLNEIADHLNLARKTVETYRRRTRKKLGIASTPKLIAHAVQWTAAQGEGDVPSA